MKKSQLLSCSPLLSAAVLLSAAMFAGAQTSQLPRIQQIGNGLKPSLSGVDIAGNTFILDDQISRDGIMFAYSAFIRSATRVRFQTWRPTVNRTSDKQFTLIAEFSVQPSVDRQREDFYVVSSLTSRCSMVQANDRLGLYFEEAPGAVAYVFEPANPSSLKYQVANLSAPTWPGEAVLFDSITFPLDFSVMAYTDTQIANISVDANGYTTCPEGLLIPDYVQSTLPPTTTQPVTGAPGATGSAGPQGATGPIGPPGPRGSAGFNGTYGATGMIGPQGVQGATGPLGNTGFNGSVGGTGFTGPVGPQGIQGSIGPAGPIGPPGPQGDTPAAVAVVDPGVWGDPDMVFYLYIWLAIVTFLLLVCLILTCCLCCLLRRLRRDVAEYAKYKKDEDYLKNVYDNPELIGTARKNSNKKNNESNLYSDVVKNKADKENNIDKQFTQLSSGGASDQKADWMSSLKPDQTFEYEVATVERDSHRNGSKRATSTGDHDPVTSNSAPNLYDRGLSTDYYSTGNGHYKDDMMY